MQGAVADGCKKLRLHVLTDGRDVPDGTSREYMSTLVNDLAALEGCDAKVASGGGRMKVTMDRYEADWAMVERGLEGSRPWRGPQQVHRPHRGSQEAEGGRVTAISTSNLSSS